jgi:hypothetical protein
MLSEEAVWSGVEEDLFVVMMLLIVVLKTGKGRSIGYGGGVEIWNGGLQRLNCDLT